MMTPTHSGQSPTVGSADASADWSATSTDAAATREASAMRLDDDVDDETEVPSIEVPLTTPPSDAAAAAVRTAHLAVRWTMRLGPTASAARSRDAPGVDMLPGK